MITHCAHTSPQGKHNLHALLTHSAHRVRTRYTHSTHNVLSVLWRFITVSAQRLGKQHGRQSEGLFACVGTVVGQPFVELLSISLTQGIDAQNGLCQLVVFSD